MNWIRPVYGHVFCYSDTGSDTDSENNAGNDSDNNSDNDSDKNSDNDSDSASDRDTDSDTESGIDPGSGSCADSDDLTTRTPPTAFLRCSDLHPFTWTRTPLCGVT